MSLSHLLELFPESGFGFSMKMRPGNAREFFGATHDGPDILTERRHWLAAGAATYAGVTNEGAEAVTRLKLQFLNWKTPLAASDSDEPLTMVLQLGQSIEPDFLLLTPDNDGRFALRAGCVCFPSSWALGEKIGRPLEEIHGVVPGLNTEIGARIHQFLARLKPGAAWLRSNWGLSSSPERNQHPARALNQLRADTPPASIWLRVEHQVLHGLEGTNAVLFGIRLENVSLAVVRADAALRAGLHRSLGTMPHDVAAYKNLTRVLPALLMYLAE